MRAMTTPSITADGRRASSRLGVGSQTFTIARPEIRPWRFGMTSGKLRSEVLEGILSRDVEPADVDNELW